MSHSLVLGTAQLGMPYGIANIKGQPDFDTVESILKTAFDQGICEFDTAQAYGNSENVLGEVLPKLGKAADVKIVSKPHPKLNHLDPIEMTQAIENTLKRLRRSSLYGLILHRENFLDLWEAGLGKILQNLVLSGLVKNIGVSLYSPKRAIQALKTEGISMIQVPFNVLDRRFEKAGVFDLARETGKMVYVRSIFLQGLLLMNPVNLPKRMQFAVPVLNEVEEIAEEFNLMRQELAIGFVKHALPFVKIIFGAETEEQVKECTECWQKKIPMDLIPRIHDQFSDVDERITNPTLWQRDI